MKKKTLTAAMALALIAGTVGTAGAASAQSRGSVYGGVTWQGDHDRRDSGWDRDRREDRRDDRRADRRDDRRDDRYERGGYERWQRSQRRYSGGRYYAPRGYQARSWGYGERMPYQYRTSQYVIRDYNRYGLRTPPRGYQYVRSGNDVILSAVTTGLVVAVIASLFQ